jgi:HD-GYP domain-containing protein (c-di-GMP phosphodiesterase class II)
MAHATLPPLRLADVLGALSLATDLANGLPAEDGLRIAILATRLAADEPMAVRNDVFWSGVLRYLGCNGFAVEEAGFASGDDIGLRKSFVRTDLGRPSQFVKALARDVGRGAGFAARAGGVLKLLASPRAAREHANAQCEAAVHCARKMSMSGPVLAALACADERFDGRGQPDGKTGLDLPFAHRCVEVARVAVLFNALGGPAGAVAELERRAGGHLDPAIVRRFNDDPQGLCRGLQQASVWDDYLASEPGQWLVDEAALTPLFEAFALLADLKSGYFAGHSQRVSALSRAAAVALGLAPDEAARLGQAALLHDLGRVVVATGTWDEPGPLSAAQWERVHLHSYTTERVLRRSPALARYADIAGRCHERLDGSGYHRGDTSIERAARLLAAADVYCACLEDRAHRPALSLDAARAALLHEVALGRLCPRAADAVLAAAGAVPRQRGDSAAALTPRELEVLKFLVRGMSNKQIARALAISPRTVQHHTIHIYAKSGVKSRAGVALWAVDQGLLSA